MVLTLTKQVFFLTAKKEDMKMREGEERRKGKRKGCTGKACFMASLRAAFCLKANVNPVRYPKAPKSKGLGVSWTKNFFAIYGWFIW